MAQTNLVEYSRDNDGFASLVSDLSSIFGCDSVSESGNYTELKKAGINNVNICLRVDKSSYNITLMGFTGTSSNGSHTIGQGISRAYYAHGANSAVAVFSSGAFPNNASTSGYFGVSSSQNLKNGGSGFCVFGGSLGSHCLLLQREQYLLRFKLNSDYRSFCSRRISFTLAKVRCHSQQCIFTYCNPHWICF